MLLMNRVFININAIDGNSETFASLTMAFDSVFELEDKFELKSIQISSK